jgi:hypothetical protein
VVGQFVGRAVTTQLVLSFCPPKAKVTRSNCVGCVNKFNRLGTPQNARKSQKSSHQRNRYPTSAFDASCVIFATMSRTGGRAGG